VMPPTNCPVYQDSRQHVGPNGQQWTTLQDFAHTSRNVICPLNPG
jgi:hypothetical protein